MIGNKDPFVQIMRTANFSSRAADYADKIRISYDKMTLPKIGSQMKEMTKTVESHIEVNSTIKTLGDNKFSENLSNKLKELCDLLDSKYSSRAFNDEKPQMPPLVHPQIDPEQEEDSPVTTDV